MVQGQILASYQILDLNAKVFSKIGEEIDTKVTAVERCSTTPPPPV